MMTMPLMLLSSATVALLLSLSAWPLAKFASVKLNIIDLPNHRKIHLLPTPRTGSILIFIGFVFGILIFRSYLYTDLTVFIIFTAMIFILGLFEDKYNMKASKRLLFQALIVYFYVAYTGTTIKTLGHLDIYTNTGLHSTTYGIDIPDILVIPFTVFCIVGCINALNLIDGLNGLASGLGILATVTLAIIAAIHKDTELTLISMILCGAIGGFMILNMTGRIFMGDAGSYLIGFMIAILSIRLINRNPEVSAFAPFLTVLIPVFDTLFAAYRRMHIKRHPFKADKRHLHHILRRRYHSDGKAVGAILAIQTILAVIAIIFHVRPVMLFAITALSSAMLIQLYINKIKLL